MLRHARVAPPEKKCAFVLTRDGRPVKVQRSIFSECFYTMAMNELWRVTAEARYQSEAVEMMDQIVHWVREDPSGLGRPQLPGAVASESMAVPMMLLCLVEQLGEEDEELAGRYAQLGHWCARRILQHVQRDGQAVLENVSEDGEELSGCLGDTRTQATRWKLAGSCSATAAGAVTPNFEPTSSTRSCYCLSAPDGTLITEASSTSRMPMASAPPSWSGP